MVDDEEDSNFVKTLTVEVQGLQSMAQLPSDDIHGEVARCLLMFKKVEGSHQNMQEYLDLVKNLSEHIVEDSFL